MRTFRVLVFDSEPVESLLTLVFQLTFWLASRPTRCFRDHYDRREDDGVVSSYCWEKRKPELDEDGSFTEDGEFDGLGFLGAD